MKIIAIGSNLPHPPYPTPLAVCNAACERLQAHRITCLCQSAWYDSAPVPPSDQPRFVNGAVAIKTDLSALEVLEICMSIEREFGRVRSERWGPRTLDLDIIAWDNEVIALPNLTIPHQEMEKRGFVLLPLGDLAASLGQDWAHPVSKSSLTHLIASLPGGDLPQRMPRQ